MRPPSLPLLASLVFLGLVQAKANSPSVRTVCTTAYCAQKGTRTQYVADETIALLKPAPPCHITETSVVTPRAATVTSVQPSVTTITVTDSQQTDIGTSTSIVWAFIYPTTTTTTTSTPPVTTTTVTVPNPSDSTTFITSYTLAAPSPTFTPTITNDRRAVAEPLEPRAAQDIVKAIQKYLSPALLGKYIYCHKEITVTSTVTKPCDTVTSYSRAPRPTSTKISTFVVPETVTQIPDHATSVVTITTTSTVTGPTITSTVTDDGTTSTVTSTATAAPSTTTMVVGEYALCDPSRFDYILFRSQAQITEFFDHVQRFDGIDDPNACCHMAVSASNAIYFIGEFSYEPTCGIKFAGTSGDCPMAVGFSGGDPSAPMGAALQCGY